MVLVSPITEMGETEGEHVQEHELAGRNDEAEKHEEKDEDEDAEEQEEEEEPVVAQSLAGQVGETENEAQAENEDGQ